MTIISSILLPDNLKLNVVSLSLDPIALLSEVNESLRLNEAFEKSRVNDFN